MNQRLAPRHSRSAAPRPAWGDDGRLHFWISTQHAHGVRGSVAGLYGLDGADGPRDHARCRRRLRRQDRIHARRGAAAWLATSGRPARALGRDPDREHGGHGPRPGQVQTVEIGGRRDGTVEAYRLTMLQDSGAYPAVGAVLPFLTRMMAQGVYAIAEGRVQQPSAVRHEHHAGRSRTGAPGDPRPPRRSSGPSTCSPPRSAWTPVEVRRRNLRPPFDEPVTTPVDTTYDTGDYDGRLDRALAAAGYDDAAGRAEASPRRGRNRSARHRRVRLRRGHRRPVAGQ